MNDFERKLRQQTFRPPPADLRDALFGRDEGPANIVEPARWTWRDWFWPSPQAWAGLAALWIVFAGLIWIDDHETSPAPAVAVTKSAESSTLFAFHSSRELHYVLNSTR